MVASSVLFIPQNALPIFNILLLLCRGLDLFKQSFADAKKNGFAEDAPELSHYSQLHKPSHRRALCYLDLIPSSSKQRVDMPNTKITIDFFLGFACWGRGRGRKTVVTHESLCSSFCQNDLVPETHWYVQGLGLFCYHGSSYYPPYNFSLLSSLALA